MGMTKIVVAAGITALFKLCGGCDDAAKLGAKAARGAPEASQAARAAPAAAAADDALRHAPGAAADDAVHGAAAGAKAEGESLGGKAAEGAVEVGAEVAGGEDED